MSEKPITQGSAIAKIATCIQDARNAGDGGHFLSPGDISSLRHMDIAIPEGACWRLLVQFVPENMRLGEVRERRWALMCKGMAVMSPNTHDGSVRPGTALAKTGYSSDDRPIRINRLLRSEGETFEDLFLSACGFLKAKAQPVDWRLFGELVLSQDDASRKGLARDFYSGSGSATSNATA